MMRRRARMAAGILIAIAAWSIPVAAHVGSPDVFLDGRAGPYRLLVTVRPPYAVPGVAQVEVLATSDDVDEIRIVPLPLTGPGAKFAPVADVTSRSLTNPRLFTGSVWMMTAGEWQVRVAVTGKRGSDQLSVPVPSLPNATLAMSLPLGVLLAALLFVLCAGLVAIAAAVAREAGLPPGEQPGPVQRRRGRIAGSATAVVVVLAVVLGNFWWSAEAADYSRYVYKPLQLTPTAVDGRLRLGLTDPGWIRTRLLDDLVEDHGHLMHLFVLSPDLDRFWHLHPREVTAGSFEQMLPAMTPGRYELFGDVVHRTGLSETATASFETAGVAGTPLRGDDSRWSRDDQPAGRIVWLRDDQPLVAGRLTMFTFRVEDESGQPARDLELYMGMPGHAVFVRRDRTVFAHVHPAGSAPMAALAIAGLALSALSERMRVEGSERSESNGQADMTHAGHDAALPPTVTFPYGFPQAGDYRIFVQIKRAGQIITGAFDALVAAR